MHGRWPTVSFYDMPKDVQLELILTFPDGSEHRGSRIKRNNRFYTKVYSNSKTIPDPRGIGVTYIPHILSYNTWPQCISFFNSLNDNEIRSLANKCSIFEKKCFHEIQESHNNSSFLFKLYRYIYLNELCVIMKDCILKNLIEIILDYLFKIPQNENNLLIKKVE